MDWLHNCGESDMEFAYRLIQEIYRRSGSTLNREEYEANANLAYVEALHTYPLYEGCCDWDAYLCCRLEEVPGEMTRQRSLRIANESPFSLSQTVKDSNQPVLEILHPHQGDFTRRVAFWDYIRQLGRDKYNIVRGYCSWETDAEIMTRFRIPRGKFYYLKRSLRADMQAYLAIDQTPYSGDAQKPSA